MADLSSYVRDLIVEECWNIDYLKNLINNDLCFKICFEVPLVFSNSKDKVVWMPQSNGEFFVKSSYDCRFKQTPNVPIFKQLWRIDVPERVKVLVWQMIHNSVSTRELCSAWFGGYAWCEHCPSIVESAIHVFQDCPLAVNVWNLFIDHHHADKFYNLNFSDWIQSNLTNSYSSSYNFIWNRIWTVGVWLFWFWRNAYVYSVGFSRLFRPAKIIIHNLLDYDQGKSLLGFSMINRVQRNIMVTWTMPSDGWLKLNCDGALILSSLCAGCGGLLRESDG